MKKELSRAQTRWELFCGILMFTALAVAILGSLPFLMPKDGSSPNSGLGDGMFFLVWAFGLTGLLLCYVGNATGKKPLAIIGFGWSASSLIWDSIAHRCRANEPCSYDTTHNGFLLTICLVALAALLIYDKKKERISAVGKFLIKAFSCSMVVVWACALLFAIATFNKPFPLRIDRTAHPITQSGLRYQLQH